MDNFESLGQFLDTRFLRTMIYSDGGTYVLYDLYEIKKSGGIYLVTRYSDGLEHSFSKLRNAASWAILDRWNKIFECRRVLELDLLVSSLATEAANHKRLQNAIDEVVGQINRDKYLNCIDRQKRFQWELDKYIVVAKLCQEKGYQNELKRVARN